MILNRHRSLTHVILLIALVVFWSTKSASAEEIFGSATIQNHVFIDREADGYTLGIFISRIRIPSQSETSVTTPLMLRPIAALFGMPQPTIAAVSLNQIMIAPRDIERSVPDPNDTPYVGELLLRTTQVSVRDETADMLAINLGVLGPAAGAAQMQRFIHRVLNDTPPEGWDKNQGTTKALIGIEGYRAWRFPLNNVRHGRANGDFVMLAGGAWGNRESSLGTTWLARYGTDLEGSFPALARITGRSGDPFSTKRGWFAYAGFSADRIVSKNGIGSNTPGNTTHLRKSQIAPLAGIAFGWSQSSLSFSVHSMTPLVESSNNRQSFGSITYIWQTP